MQKLGKKQLTLQLAEPLSEIPATLQSLPLTLSENHMQLVYTFDAQTQKKGIASLLRQLSDEGIDFQDLYTSESSLEDIFVKLIGTSV